MTWLKLPFPILHTCFFKGLRGCFFLSHGFSLSLFNCLNNALEILLYAWLIGLNKVVHLILVIYLITDGFSPMVFIIHHIYIFEDWILKTFRIRPNLASTMLMSPTMAAGRIYWRYHRTRLWTPCNFMASLTILTVNIIWRLTSHLTIFFARTRIKVYNRSKRVEEIGKSIELIQRYSYLFNVKIVGLPEIKASESAFHTTILAELAERSPITIQNSSNPSSQKNLVVRPYDRTRCYF